MIIERDGERWILYQFRRPPVTLGYTISRVNIYCNNCLLIAINEGSFWFYDDDLDSLQYNVHRGELHLDIYLTTK